MKHKTIALLFRMQNGRDKDRGSDKNQRDCTPSPSRRVAVAVVLMMTNAIAEAGTSSGSCLHLLACFLHTQNVDETERKCTRGSRLPRRSDLAH